MMRSKIVCYSMILHVYIIQVQGYVVSNKFPHRYRADIISRNMRILTGQINSVATDDEYVKTLKEFTEVVHGDDLSTSIWGLFLDERIGQLLLQSPPEVSRSFYFMNMAFRKITKWCDAGGQRNRDSEIYADCKGIGRCFVVEVSIKYVHCWI